MKTQVVHHQGTRCRDFGFGFGWYVLVTEEDTHAGDDLVAILGPYPDRRTAEHEAEAWMSHQVAE